MAQKGAPTVAGTSQNWAQNASQSTQNPLQKCTGQPYIHTGNAKIADFIAVENQMKIWIIKSHVFHFPVCVSGSNGRPRRPKNAENLSKNNKKIFKNRVGSTARLSGRVVGQSYARFKAEIELQNIRTTPEHDSQPPNVHFEVLCPAAATPAPSRPGPHTDWTKIFSCAVSTLASKCLATYAGVKNCFSQHSRRVTRRLAARLKAELALDNIPKASGMHTLQSLTRKCDPKIVSYLKQGAS